MKKLFALPPELHPAFAQVAAAFAHRRKPRSIPHCPMCYRDDEVAAFLALELDEMPPCALSDKLIDCYICWGTYREISWYIPMLLQLWSTGLINSATIVFSVLLPPARPDLRFDCGVPEIGETMPAEERDAIARFVSATLEWILKQANSGALSWEMKEIVAFLAALDYPIAHLIDRLICSEDRLTCANLCLFLAENAGGCNPLSTLSVDRIANLTFPPANEAVLKRLFAPEFVASYLVAHVEDVALLGPEAAAQVDEAFSWIV